MPTCFHARLPWLPEGDALMDYGAMAAAAIAVEECEEQEGQAVADPILLEQQDLRWAPSMHALREASARADARLLRIAACY